MQMVSQVPITSLMKSYLLANERSGFDKHQLAAVLEALGRRVQMNGDLPLTHFDVAAHELQYDTRFLEIIQDIKTQKHQVQT